ncbi:MAG: hemin uptake protein HemP [Variovorax sp.]|nr:MAG: hemin uptake protein HemP [Variovorax sp.]
MQATAQAYSVLNHPSLDNSGRGTSASLQAHPAATLVESADLLKGQKTVGILHNGSLYRLQATKLGKLILTK